MSAPPFMPFYIADYLGDTQHLSTEQHGAYTLLLFAMWRAGGEISSDPKMLARIVRMSPAKWERTAGVVLAFFDIENGTISHGRLSHELEKANKKSIVRSTSGKRGAEAKALKKQKSAEAKASRLLKHSSDIRHQTSESSLRDDNRDRARDDGWPDDFRDQFWAAYPRKLEKKAALAALERIRKSAFVPWEKLIAAVRAYAATADPDFTKHPTTWLNKGCWDDEIKPRASHERPYQNRTHPSRPAPTNADVILAGVARSAERRFGSQSPAGGGATPGRSDPPGGDDAVGRTQSRDPEAFGQLRLVAIANTR